jgi:murein DD-endopeptidase MepM/ murein hydrolase activator NlpD
MPHREHQPVSVEFPLRGEWAAITSPGDRVPSHGTDVLAQRFAYDFIRTDRRPGWHVHPASTWRHLAFGVPTRECYAWGEPVHMPFDGEIVEARDGFPERSRVFPLREAAVALKNAATFDPRGDLRRIMGNHVIAASGDGVFAGFVHLAPQSIMVTPGQVLRAGDLVGRVGHTGNSTSPHLHFQLMDGPDPRSAAAIPCAFTELEVEGPSGWTRARDVVPQGRRRLRYQPESS